MTVANSGGAIGPPGPLAASIANTAAASSYPPSGATWLYGSLLAVQSVAGYPGVVWYYYSPSSAATADGVNVLTASSGRFLILSFQDASTGVLAVGQTEVDMPVGPFAVGVAASKAAIVSTATTDGSTWVNFGPAWTFPTLTAGQVARMSLWYEVAVQNTVGGGGASGNLGDEWGFTQEFHAKKIGVAAPTVNATGSAVNQLGDTGENGVTFQVIVSGQSIQAQIKGIVSHTLRVSGSSSVTFG